jgi:hypothetical protein
MSIEPKMKMCRCGAAWIEPDVRMCDACAKLYICVECGEDAPQDALCYGCREAEEQAEADHQRAHSAAVLG